MLPSYNLKIMVCEEKCWNGQLWSEEFGKCTLLALMLCLCALNLKWPGTRGKSSLHRYSYLREFCMAFWILQCLSTHLIVPGEINFFSTKKLTSCYFCFPYFRMYRNQHCWFSDFTNPQVNTVLFSSSILCCALSIL